MRTKTVEKVVKHSIVYGYAITQPFAFYIDAQPLFQDKLLAETEGFQYGENSEIVRHLQYKLSKLGHYEDAIDGVFGLLTEHAIKGFQSSYQITITGQADKQTMQALIQAEKQAEIDKIKDLIVEIDYGSQNLMVKQVQEVLFYYGYYQGSVDGIYGPLTENAINQVKYEGLLILDNAVDDIVVDQSEHDAAPIAATITIDEEKHVAEDNSVTTTNDHDIIQLDVKSNDSSMIQTAKSYMGTPYVWGGTSPSGFDCSGFIQYVFQRHDYVIPRTVNEIWNFSSPVNSPSVGDLVFFETYQPGPSHLGIYLGNGDFIHAGSSNGVTISNLEESYWKTRYIGAKRISQ